VSPDPLGSHVRTGEIRAVVFSGSRVLLRVAGAAQRLPTVAEVTAAFDRFVLESAQVSFGPPGPEDADALAFSLTEGVAPPDGYRFDGLRAAWYVLEHAEFRVAGTLWQKIEWRRTHRFCSVCGIPTEADPRHRALSCPSCGQLHFPRIAPAVIVLVERDGRALLGRSSRFPPGVYSTLAGFVEPGESLEECVHREIYEEAGVRVTNLRYFGSQPHPFPHSLMVGFVADWHSGEIRVDTEELEDARWFTPDDLPELPHPMSIAHALIVDFVKRAGQ
jgi:NAD+ diphosphatase